MADPQATTEPVAPTAKPQKRPFLSGTPLGFLTRFFRSRDGPGRDRPERAARRAKRYEKKEDKETVAPPAVKGIST